MEEKKPETKFYERDWYVYQIMNRESPNFHNDKNLIHYSLNIIKENTTYKNSLLREKQRLEAVTDSNEKVDYYEPGYKTSIVTSVLTLLSMGVAITTFISKTASSETSPKTISQIELNNIYNSNSSFSTPTSDNSSSSYGISIPAFIVPVVAAILTATFAIITLNLKSQATQKKELNDWQIKLIKRESKINAEIALKNRVILKLFKLLGVVMDNPNKNYIPELLSEYSDIIRILDHRDSLNLYTELERKLDLLLNADDSQAYKDSIFKYLKEKIYNQLASQLKRINFFSQNEFVTKFNEFQTFYQTIAKLTVVADRYSYIYAHLTDKINELSHQIELEKPDPTNLLAKFSFFSEKSDKLAENQRLRKKVKELKQQLKTFKQKNKGVQTTEKPEKELLNLK